MAAFASNRLLLSLLLSSTPQNFNIVLYNDSICDNVIILNPSKHHKGPSTLSNSPSRSSKSSSLYLALLLLTTSKDIESNPGPGPVKYPCQICGKAVKWTTPGVCCDSCDGWYHKSCMGMSSGVYSGLQNVSWYCCKCGLPNFSSALFDTMCLDETNPFSPLSTTPLSPELPEVDIGSPAASSSPKQNKNIKAKKNGRHDIPLKVIVVNCQSVVNKKAEMLNLVDATQADVIIGTESWLTSDIPDSEICPPGYTMFRKNRVNRTGGGVFIMISCEFISTDPGFPVPEEVEMVWAQLQVSGSKTISICSFYRPPDNSDQNYLNALKDIVTQIDTSRNHVWIAGDFNLGNIDWQNTSTKPNSQYPRVCEQLIDLVNDHGLTQMVDKPTRTTSTTSNILDIFLTNTPDMVNRCETIPGISDHDIPFLDVSSRVILNKKAPRKIYQFHKADFDAIVKTIANFGSTFCQKYAHSKSWNVEEMWEGFKQAILQAMDLYIPTKTISSKKQSPPWIDRPIKLAIKKRNRLFKRAQQTQNSADRAAYADQRSKVQAMIRHSYWRHMENKIIGDSGEPTANIQKNFWSYIKATKKDRVGTAPLKNNNILYSDPKSKAEILNKQYQSVFSKEDPVNIPSPTEPPSPPMPDIEVSREGVLKLLLDLKENKASGPDKIPTRILKVAAEPISHCLQLLFTASLHTGIVPNDWKQANITPVFKKGERFKASNYRPVSLTCICSKLMEHVVVSQMMSHFDKHDILVDCQHGFRKQRSCETQLLGLTQELHEHFEEHEQVDMIILDFSKAFDKVPHQRLMAKLWNYGVRGKTHAWIKSFLVGRTQRVVVDGEASSWVPVESGVPQGTVLGPQLFLTFINDLPKAVKSNVRLFADDCVVYREVKSEEDCAILQDDLDSLENWEKQWCMSFNAAKCSSIAMTRKHKKILHQYKLHNQTLERVDKATYLGVQLSSDLSWASHINKTCDKANKQVAFLRRNLRINTTHVKETAYKGLVRPILEYYSPVWDPYNIKKYVTNIEKVQRRAARFVCRRFHNMSSPTEMIQQLKWESLEHRRRISRLTMFYKIQHGLVAVPLPTIVTRALRPRPGYPHQYQINYYSTNSYRDSFFPLAIKQWNSLPSSIASKDTLPLFQGALSSHSF